MWLNEHALIHKQDISLSKPFVNAAGVLGFAPDPHSLPYLDHLGAFFTNPISRRPRQPASNRTFLSYPGGFLLHSGLQNPGITRAVSRFKQRWAGAPLPVIVHLLVETPETLAEMVRKLEGLENVMAVELGLPPDCDPAVLPAIMQAAAGELPVIISLSADSISVLLEPIKSIQPAALHVTSPRGTLPDSTGTNITGRLFGPATMPVMMHSAQILVDAGLQVIVDGGSYTSDHAQALIKTGVAAVGLGSVLWQIELSELFPTA